MKILFAATSSIALPALKKIYEHGQLVGLLTQPDRPVGRKQVMTPPPTKEWLLRENPSLPCFQPEKLKESSILESLKELDPDLIVTFSYGKIFPKELLSLAPYGAINIHTSLLPKFRGASPIQAAILAGEKVTGVTLMQMEEGLDSGPILLQKSIEVDSEETTQSLEKKLEFLSAEILVEGVENFHQLQPRLQPSEGISYAPLITRERSLLLPEQSALSLERQVRAFNPKPGAYGLFSLSPSQSLEAKIWRAKAVFNSCLPSSAVGSFFIQGKELYLLCGEGALLIEEIQPLGRVRMSGAAFIQGYGSHFN